MFRMWAFILCRLKGGRLSIDPDELNKSLDKLAEKVDKLASDNNELQSIVTGFRVKARGMHGDIGIEKVKNEALEHKISTIVKWVETHKTYTAEQWNDFKYKILHDLPHLQ